MSPFRPRRPHRLARFAPSTPPPKGEARDSLNPCFPPGGKSPVRTLGNRGNLNSSPQATPQLFILHYSLFIAPERRAPTVSGGCDTPLTPPPEGEARRATKGRPYGGRRVLRPYPFRHGCAALAATPPPRGEARKLPLSQDGGIFLPPICVCDRCDGCDGSGRQPPNPSHPSYLSPFLDPACSSCAGGGGGCTIRAWKTRQHKNAASPPSGSSAPCGMC